VAATSSVQPLTAGAVYRRLLGYSAKHWPLAIVALIGMLIEAGAAGAFTAMMEPMIDGTFVQRDPKVIAWLPFAIVALFVTRGVATFVTDYGIARIGRSVVYALRGEVLAKFLRLPTAFFDREPVASLVAKLSYNTEQVAQASADAVKTMITETLTLCALLTVMLMQSVRLTATMLVMGPAIAAVVYVVGLRYRRIHRNIQGSIGELSHAAEQSLGAQHEVKVYGAQEQEQARFALLARRNQMLNIKVAATQALSSSLVQFFAACALAAIVYMAGREAVKQGMTAGMFVSLISAMMAMLPSLKRITNVQGMLQKGVAAATGLFGVLDAPEERDAGTLSLSRARGLIEYDAVSVSYAPGETVALDRLSFRAEPGTLTAIVGRSGSGKSTLVRLLPRLYEAHSGSIKLDGRALSEYKLADLRRQIALVSQNVVLFDDTVARNVAYGELSSASSERVVAALEAANAMEFVARLPQGLDTRIGDAGSLLSGGQRQRLAIARAILKDAPILILDEATSALDNESERLIQEALARIVRDRTTLVIAHRLSTIERANQVLVLDHGRLVEHGTHAELLARGGHYAYLHRLQFRDDVAA
jgi:subfamily B ATP-binding cassette protein MsbA